MDRLIDWLPRKRHRHRAIEVKMKFNQLVGAVFKTSLTVRKIWGSISRPVKSGTASLTAHHHCDVPSELCCLGVKRGDGFRHLLLVSVPYHDEGFDLKFVTPVCFRCQANRST